MLWKFGAFLGRLKTATLTASRDWTWPDRSGPIVIDGGPAATYRPAVAVTGSKTLALTDIGTRQDCTNASAATITIPLNATVAFPIGTEIFISRRTSQSVNVGAVGGVTIQGDGTTAITGAQSVVASATLIKTATDTWQLLMTPSATGRMNTSGLVTPSQARVNRTAAYSLTAVTAPVKLDFDTTVSQFPASSISLNGRYTVTAANTGIYLVNVYFVVTSSTVCTLSLTVTVGGVAYRVVDTVPFFTAGETRVMKGSTQVHLPLASNYVECTISSNASTNLTFAVGPANMYFDLVKIA